jgi:hypothetical protein
MILLLQAARKLYNIQLMMRNQIILGSCMNDLSSNTVKNVTITLK